MESSEASSGAWKGGDEHAIHAEGLDRALLGSLPCAFCGYELKGLSIRGKCSECGTAVRATILYTVDPQADEFKPIILPRLVALSLIGLLGSLFLATTLSWWPHLAESIRMVTGTSVPSSWAADAGRVLVLAGAVCGFGLIRPTSATRVWTVLAALCGAAGLVVIAMVWMRITRFDGTASSAAYLDGITGMERVQLRLMLEGAALVAIFGLRPNIRELVRRSMAMRTGQVDRQTMLVMAATVGIMAVGDAIRMGAIVLHGPGSEDQAEMLDWGGQLLVVLCSALLTLGLLSGLVDAIRLRRSILTPSPSLRGVLHGEHES